MTDLVDPTEIERIVGASRHPSEHLGRAVSAEGKVYILHSRACVDSGIDLRECEYSRTLDRGGVSAFAWECFEDRPVALMVSNQYLVPSIPSWLAESPSP